MKFTLGQLIELGLSKYKARAYYALCGYDVLKAIDITKASGVPQSKIYDIMAELMFDGMVEETAIKSHKAWKAVPLSMILDKRIKVLEDLKRSVS